MRQRRNGGGPLLCHLRTPRVLLRHRTAAVASHRTATRTHRTASPDPPDRHPRCLRAAAPPGPSEPSGRTSRRGLFAAGALALAALAAGAFWFFGRPDDTTASPSPSATPGSTTTASPAPTPAPTPSESPSPTPGAARWIGQEYRGDGDPAPGQGVSEIGGALLEAPDRGVSLVSTPEGFQFWYLQLTRYEGPVPVWRVLDAVPALGDPYTDVIVLGATQCTVDGVQGTGVVGSFVAEDEPTLTRLIGGYRVDTAVERLVVLTAAAACANETYGL